MPSRTSPPKNTCTSLILPAYNPGPALNSTWRRLHRFIETAPGNWEVLFICDGCTDGTAERLQRWKKPNDERLRILGYPDNRGKGFAVRLGLASARGQYRIFTDIDLAYGIADIYRLAQHLWKGAPVAVASRTHPNSRVVHPPHLRRHIQRRHHQSRLYSSLARFLLSFHYQDPQAGLKGFQAGALEQLLPSLRCWGFAFDCELLAACVRLGIPVTEVPVTVRYNAATSTTTLPAALTMLRDLWRLRWASNSHKPEARARERLATLACASGLCGSQYRAI